MTFESVSTRKSLKDRAKEFSTQLPLMTDRQKGNIAPYMGTVITLTDYGFMVNEKGQEYVVFIIAEDETQFFFGGQVLTDQLHKLDDEGYGDDIRAEGLPMVMSERKSKSSGRTYANVEFYPGEE